MKRIALLAASAAFFTAMAGTPARAAVSCPSPVPVLNENNCMGAGTTAWRLTSYNQGIAGFATQTSVNLGTAVSLKIARSSATPSIKTVNVDVYRMGWYGGTGARRIAGASAAGVSVNNAAGCTAPDATTGRSVCNWAVSYTIPGSQLPASGVYLAKLTANNGWQNYVIFTVRDDARSSALLYKLPIATYEAYNGWGGKGLYDFNSTGANTVAGTPRAVKVSFDRPFDGLDNRNDFFLDADFPMVEWLERQGYDVGYTDDVAAHSNAASLLNHKALVVSGHSEYWSLEEFNNYKAARDAGVSIASFSANTAYWKVRYEDSGRTLVAYKTVQGTGSTGSGSAAVNGNDWGPDGRLNTADDALGADHKVGGTGVNADHPENATTTFRDNGAPAGDPNAPQGGRVGPDLPENSLFGVMYIGDNDAYFYGMTIPATNAAGEYSGDRTWRHLNLPTSSATSLSQAGYVGWEWDAVPGIAQYAAREPAGVKRVTSSPVASNGALFIQDEGRVYSTTPPAGQPGVSNAIRYTAPSGAQVFAAGTIQWSWGLAPHLEANVSGTMEDNTDSRLQQATYNVLADMGAQPATPAGITLDGANAAPTAAFTFSPVSPTVGQAVSFDGTGSRDPDGTIAKYEWDFNGDGTYDATGITTTRSYTSAGTYAVTLRVTDNSGATDVSTQSVTVSAAAPQTYPQAIQATSGLIHYWRMGETSGTTLADSKGTSNATASGVTLGVPGAIAGDSNGAVRFNGTSSSASAAVDLSGTRTVTAEFWLKWSVFDQSDDLAMELTPNFNTNAGGFLVDPDESATGQGRFGVSVRQGADYNGYNNAFFARPTAGAWHHYALVLDKAQPGASEITVYVDGTAVATSKLASTDTTDAFANSVLYFMSRGANALFGGGDLDEVALYNRALTAAEVSSHYRMAGAQAPANQSPTASFTTSPASPTVGQTVTFDASASRDPDGSISRYEWDWDGDGTYDTTTTAATANHAYGTAGTYTAKLRVTDDQGATATQTKSVTVAASSPPTQTYAQMVAGTAGLLDYWRMGETSGSTLADSKGTSNASASGVTLAVPGAIAGDSNGAARFNGTSSFASAPVNLAGTRTVTLELWLRWNAFDQSDDLAMELTPNSGTNAGGFLVDPDESATGLSKFGVSVRQGPDYTGYDNAFFDRPAAGFWHHYAIVFDKTAAAAGEITVYVDGVRQTTFQTSSFDTTDGFANSTLYFMSRAGGALFGAGDLDEVALYDRALSAATVQAHYTRGITAG